jgi:NAD(P)-dependent dehydrogenase (short-subunit alcohol dehydrogenase family)
VSPRHLLLAREELGKGREERGECLREPFPSLCRVFRREEWQKLFNINFFALVHTIQVALSKLRESKGTIVLVSSGAAEKGNAGWGVRPHLMLARSI